MEQKDYSALLPTVPPEGIMDFVIENSAGYWDALIMSRRKIRNPMTDEVETMCHIQCSACGHEEYLTLLENGCATGWGFYNETTQNSVQEGNKTICPNCKKRMNAKVKNVWNDTVNSEWVMTVTAIAGRLALIGWDATRKISKDGTICDTVKPYEAYVVEPRKLVRLAAWSGGGWGNRYHEGKWTQRKKMQNYWPVAELIFPWSPEVLKGTTAENSRLDKFLELKKPCAVGYLWLWTKQRQVENVVEQGHGRFLNDEINKMTSYYGENRGLVIPAWDWKAKRPCDLIGMTKTEFSGTRTCETDQIRKFLEIKKHGGKVTTKDIAALEMISLYDCEKKDGTLMLKTARYLIREKRAGRRHDKWLLDDYWRMAREIELDMTIHENMWPSRLEKAHDWAMVEADRQRERLEGEYEKAPKEMFDKRVEFLRQFSWENGEFCIFPAKSEDELVLEGKLLHHCVGKYGKDMAFGLENVFFLRKMKEPEKPWFTVDVRFDGGFTVYQNLGKKNCQPSKAATKFVEEWTQRARKKLKPKKKQRKVEVA